jgi:hypothetical protein
VADHLDKTRCLAWLTTTRPAWRARAAAARGLLLSGDEASFAFAPWGSLGYTWARVGHQPVVQTTGRRKAYNVFGLVEERARLTNRLQTVLEDANVKLAAVVTDVRGVSARAILEALVAGETDPTTLAELARGRLRTKRELLARAVVGRFTAHHAFLIAEQLSHLDYLEEAMDRVSAEFAQRPQEERAALELLDTVPGRGRRAAEILLAELGADLAVSRDYPPTSDGVVAARS